MIVENLPALGDTYQLKSGKIITINHIEVKTMPHSDNTQSVRTIVSEDGFKYFQYKITCKTH